MTNEDRVALKHLINHHRRQQLGQPGRLTCSRCGCDHDTRTAGCKTCANRWLRRKWRHNDDWRIRDNARRNNRRREREAA